MKKCTRCGQLYPDDATSCPQDGQPLVPVASSSAPPQTGLAITSLILGILSFVLCFFTAIPAIICGHIALNRSRKYPAEYGGGGMALAGLITGYVGMCLSLIFMVGILSGLFLPALAKAKQKAESIRCVNNLKQIGLSTTMWADSHDGMLPHNFLEMTNELGSPALLVCPATAKNPAAMPTTWNRANITYQLLTPGMPRTNVLTVPIVRCPIHGNELYGDGSVHRGQTPAAK